MYNQIKTLQKISKDISGLKVTFDNFSRCHIKYSTIIRRAYINLNLEELDNTPIYKRIQRKHNVKYFYLIVLLHEIGHYKKLRKFKSIREFYNWRFENFDYNEKTADRYATRYYKKYVKN